jgi:ABC-type nitrate/sulfonate/bicarbonate transport system permease component
MGTEEIAASRQSRAGTQTSFLDTRSAPIVLGTVGVLVFVGLCEAVIRVGLISSVDVPPPSLVIARLATAVTKGSFWSLTGQTLEGWGYGLAIAIVLGIGLGLLIGSNELLWRACRPTVEFLRPVPSISLIPVTILLYGNGLKGNVILTAFGSIWPILIQSIYGVREVDDVARSTMRSYGVGGWLKVRYLIFPTALPFIATGLRIASAVALIVTVTSELVIGTPGLGSALILAENGGDVKLTYAYVLAIGLLGLILYTAFSMVERRFLRWHPSQRRGPS